METAETSDCRLFFNGRLRLRRVQFLVIPTVHQWHFLNELARNY